jgi:hypothetical protein
MVYLLLPPVAFYVNYRFKWGIPAVGLCLILLLVGWILPFLEVEFINGQFYPGLEGPAAIVAIPCGWAAYGFVLMFWAMPIAIGAIIISERKRRKEQKTSESSESPGQPIEES